MRNTSDCPVCNSTSIAPANYKFNEYDMYSCDNCKVIFCLPFKAPGAEFYIEAGDILSESRHKKLAPWIKDHPTRKSVNLNNGQARELLDFGCGNGSFLEFASEKGFNVVGIDFDEKSLEAARKRKYNTKFDLFNSDLETYQKNNPEKQFDIIAAFEVIEHLDNPKEVLRQIHQMLKPGGLFIGTLPNLKRPLIKVINMTYEIPPYHLTYWTAESWRNVLESYFGFKRISNVEDAFCGLLSYQLKHKLLQKLGWADKKNIGNLTIRSFFIFTGFFESRLEHLLKRGGSFYFEMKKI